MNRMRDLAGTSLVMALVQSVCTTMLAINGARLAAGLTAFAPAGGMAAPIRWFHQDSIRIPMLLVASIRAIADLVMLSSVRRLHSEPATQRRLRKPSEAATRSGRLQYMLAVATLVLVAAESGSHAIIVHRTHSHLVVRQVSTNGE